MAEYVIFFLFCDYLQKNIIQYIICKSLRRKNIMGDAIKLIGIVIVIIGFALKFDTLATVVVAGIVTGLVGGMSIMDILSTLGSAFLTNRTATLFILTLPVIGLCERMGLRDKPLILSVALKVRLQVDYYLFGKLFVLLLLHFHYVLEDIHNSFVL